jgi:GTP-binding protein
VLIHLLDGLSQEPLIDFAQINTELALFDPQLALKPQVIVYNKMDLPRVKERWPQVKRQLKERGYENVFAISAATNDGVRPVLYQAAQLLEETPDIEDRHEADVEEMPVYRLEGDPNAFAISKTPRGWRITGKALERAASMTYWEYYQSVRRFQRIMELMGVDAAMRKAGVEPGDTVLIGDHELIWEE